MARALDEPSACAELLESPDVLENCFALWGLANRDIRQAKEAAETLLAAEEKCRGLLGFYFLSNVENGQVMHEKAVKYVEDGDPGAMAWAASCFYQGSWYGSMWGFDGKSRVEERPACELPEDEGERRRQFECLDRALSVIGKKERVFHESVFPWMEKSLSALPVINCMMALAVYDMDEELAEKPKNDRNISAAISAVFFMSILWIRNGKETDRSSEKT